MKLKYNHNHEELLPSELQWWKRWFQTKGAVAHCEKDYIWRTDNEAEIEINSWMFKGVSAKDKILDIGCGPLPGHGSKIKGEKVNIIALDPLAEEYNKLIEEYAPQVEFRGIKGTGENLLDIFKNEEFDMVISANALDHSRDPILCIQNMIKVCKKNGIVRFCVAENEAVRSMYNGLHQWNFTVHDDKLKLWNKEGETFVEEHIDCEYIKIDSEDWSLFGSKGLLIEIKPPAKIL